MNDVERLCGKLSSELETGCEGQATYVFLDDAKSGYDAWVTPVVGDTLLIYDQNQTFRYDLTIPLRERNFGKFNPPIRSYWFDKGYSAELFRKVKPQQAPLRPSAPPAPPKHFASWGVSPRALDLIATERGRQDAQHGGEAHDDTNAVTDWLIFVNRQIGKLSYPPSRGNLHQFHLKVLTKIAALAVAGMESVIRKNNL